MERTTTILLIICAILVAALSLAVGVLIGHPNNASLAMNTTNNTTASINNTTNQTQTVKTTDTQKKSTNNMISASQAKNIALNYAGSGWSVGSVDFVPAANYENTPNYMVELEDPSTHISRDVRVNANTGAIME